jgi:hypothetical protein
VIDVSISQLSVAGSRASNQIAATPGTKSFTLAPVLRGEGRGEGPEALTHSASHARIEQLPLFVAHFQKVGRIAELPAGVLLEPLFTARSVMNRLPLQQRWTTTLCETASAAASTALAISQNARASTTIAHIVVVEPAISPHVPQGRSTPLCLLGPPFHGGANVLMNLSLSLVHEAYAQLASAMN